MHSNRENAIGAYLRQWQRAVCRTRELVEKKDLDYDGASSPMVFCNPPWKTANTKTQPPSPSRGWSSLGPIHRPYPFAFNLKRSNVKRAVIRNSGVTRNLSTRPKTTQLTLSILNTGKRCTTHDASTKKLYF